MKDDLTAMSDQALVESLRNTTRLTVINTVCRRVVLGTFCAFLVSQGWAWVPVALFVLLF